MTSRILLAFFCGLFISCNHSNNTNESDSPEDNNYISIPASELDKIKVCTEMPLHPDSVRTGTRQASGKRWTFWEKSKRVLYVAFIDGDSIVKENVKAVSREWENHCGKEFKFINAGEAGIQADITISFKDKDSWSLIGKDSKSKTPSMNLGWLTANTDEEEYRRVVLHEFGHALGLVHEHQNPENNPIKWNKEYVYAFYKQKFGWEKKVTYTNFFERYSINEMNSSAFDSKSIMLYEIPEKFTLDGFHTIANTELSETDKRFIGMIYPKN